MPTIVLLGPQRRMPTVNQAVLSQGVEGPLAAITAGWQEREAEVGELDAHLGRHTVNLMLHRRVEGIFRRDPDFREAHRLHQDSLKRLQAIYRRRLDYTLGMAQQLMARRASARADLLEPEIEDAFEAVRALDRHHLGRIRELNGRFQAEQRPHERADVLDCHYELAAILSKCEGVAIAGGHVAVLLNRMRLLNLTPLIEDKTIFAWSAGAMALGSQIVLFHDTPPQGRGFAEVFEAGLGLFDGLLPLPHAGKRLLLDQAPRVELFARRFSDSACLTLEDGSRVDWRDNHWQATANVARLREDGEVENLAEAAA